MHSIAARLEALASNARERQGSHPDDSTDWHYEHGVGDAYAYAARIVSQFAQGGTVAYQHEVVPFSSPAVDDMNSAQAEARKVLTTAEHIEWLRQLGGQLINRALETNQIFGSRHRRPSEEQEVDAPAPISPLQYIDDLLLALAPATIKAMNGTPDTYYFIGNLGQLMHQLLKMRFRHYGCKNLSSSSSSSSFVGSSAFDEEGNAPPTIPFESEGPPCESI